MKKIRHSTSSVIVSSTIDSSILLQKAESLARKLGLRYIPCVEQNESEILLCFTDVGLKLLHRDHLLKTNSYLLFVDFVNGPHGYRLARNRTIKQPLAKAVGIKSGYRPRIFDATAGLGGDSFVFASLGCRVTLSERHPVILALLEDGIERASIDPKTRDIVKDHMTLLFKDSKEHILNMEEKYDTIYLDPMYPHRTSSALGKQVMRTIRQIVGDDDDSTELIEAAMKSGASRIVVKRPKLASQLIDRIPDHVVKMKSNRFDIYFPR